MRNKLEKQADEIRELEKQLIEDINKKRASEGKEPIKVDGYFIDELQEQLKRNIIIEK